MAILQQVLGLFLLLLCGLVAMKAKWINKQGITGLNTVVMKFSLPAQIFAKLQVEATSEMAVDLIHVFIIAAVSMLLFGLIAWIAFVSETPNRRTVLTGMAMFSNAGFMGFPVLTAAFGESNLIYGVIYVAVFNLICWSVGVMLFDRKSVNAKMMLTSPALIASIAGVICFAADWKIPAFLTSTLNMMGDATTPLAMFIVGSHLSSLKLADLLDGKMLVVSAMRLLIFPLVAYGVLSLLGVSYMVNASITLLTAMPCGALIVVLAERYGGDAVMASKGVSTSTALSVVTIPLIMLIFA
ncbi:MAG: AEC family transporter [Clostridiales bacterium]|nr:AEC family transporter [Clostridiales bacterium]